MRKIIQMFSVFSFPHTQKNIFYIGNLNQKELLGRFPEDIKMWQSHNVLNWCTNNWLHDIYVASLGLNYYYY